MADEFENNSVRVIYSSLSSNLPGPPDFKIVFERSLAATRDDGGGSTTVFEVMPRGDDVFSRKTYVLTAAPGQETSASSLEDTLERCESFIRNSKGNSKSSMTALVEQHVDGNGASAVSQSVCLMILSKLERNSSEENISPSSKLLQTADGIPLNMDAAAEIRAPKGSLFWHNWRFPWRKSHAY